MTVMPEMGVNGVMIDTSLKLGYRVRIRACEAIVLTNIELG